MYTAALNFPAASSAQARNGEIDRAIPGCTTAQPWDPSLPSCDPVARAQTLAKAAQTPKDP